MSWRGRLRGRRRASRRERAAAAAAAWASAVVTTRHRGQGRQDDRHRQTARRRGQLGLSPGTWTAPLVRPGDASWKTPAHQLYNTRFDNLKPAAVACVANADDIRLRPPLPTRPRPQRQGLDPQRAKPPPTPARSSGDNRLIVDVSKPNKIRASGNSAVVGAAARQAGSTSTGASPRRAWTIRSPAPAPRSASPASSPRRRPRRGLPGRTA
ncbi:hypothetical protein ACRAWF_26525 [Streptomyces sp. L7]